MLKVGQLLLLRAVADCLPTPMNLCCWKYRVSNLCSLYSSPTATTAHILNGFPEALNQGHYTWRHDSVLNCLLSNVSSKTDDTTRCFTDLPGRCATIPPDISTTTSRPYLVLIPSFEVMPLELTIPSNSPGLCCC